MGQFCMADTLEATLSETFGRKSFTDDPAIYQLLNRAAPVFWQIIQIYCFNQSRQREKLEFELESLASHMRESVNLLSKGFFEKLLIKTYFKIKSIKISMAIVTTRG